MKRGLGEKEGREVMRRPRDFLSLWGALRFTDAARERQYKAWFAKQHYLQDICLYAMEQVFLVSIIAKTSLEHEACVVGHDVSGIPAPHAVLGFPCSGTAWEKLFYGMSMLYPLNVSHAWRIRDMSLLLYIVSLYIALTLSILAKKIYVRPIVRNTVNITIRVLMLLGHFFTLWWITPDRLFSTTAGYYSLARGRCGLLFVAVKGISVAKTPFDIHCVVGLVEWLLCCMTMRGVDMLQYGQSQLTVVDVLISLGLVYILPTAMLYTSEKRLRFFYLNMAESNTISEDPKPGMAQVPTICPSPLEAPTTAIRSGSGASSSDAPKTPERPECLPSNSTSLVPHSWLAGGSSSREGGGTLTDGPTSVPEARPALQDGDMGVQAERVLDLQAGGGILNLDALLQKCKQQSGSRPRPFYQPKVKSFVLSLKIREHPGVDFATASPLVAAEAQVAIRKICEQIGAFLVSQSVVCIEGCVHLLAVVSMTAPSADIMVRNLKEKLTKAGSEPDLTRSLEVVGEEEEQGKTKTGPGGQPVVVHKEVPFLPWECFNPEAPNYSQEGNPFMEGAMMEMMGAALGLKIPPLAAVEDDEAVSDEVARALSSSGVEVINSLKDVSRSCYVYPVAVEVDLEARTSIDSSCPPLCPSWGRKALTVVFPGNVGLASLRVVRVVATDSLGRVLVDENRLCKKASQGVLVRLMLPTHDLDCGVVHIHLLPHCTQRSEGATLLASVPVLMLTKEAAEEANSLYHRMIQHMGGGGGSGPHLGAPMAGPLPPPAKETLYAHATQVYQEHFVPLALELDGLLTCPPVNLFKAGEEEEAIKEAYGLDVGLSAALLQAAPVQAEVAESLLQFLSDQSLWSLAELVLQSLERGGYTLELRDGVTSSRHAVECLALEQCGGQYAAGAGCSA